jgi:hypothetical protein
MGFWRPERHAYRIDASVMAVAVKGTKAAAQKNQDGDM